MYRIASISCVVILHELGIEAVPDEVSGPAMTLIGSHGVTRVEHLHPSREAAVRDLHQEVKVIAHQDVRPANPAVLDRDLREETQPLHAVDLVPEHHLPVVPARTDVVDAVGLFEAKLARHGATVAAQPRLRSTPRSLVTVTSQNGDGV